ncbi:MAG: 16S rRNA (cytosine(967)-C(5))-methyltransferase RsmB [Betaproteobacteria bacterium]|nr:16S rRNA (cytosine(967)-C(5))-methyltransferase RsmB [Betaproteobacteria bacterium]
MTDARTLAAHLVNAVLLEGRSLTQAQSSLPELPPRTLAAARHLAYGALRHAGRLHFYVRWLAERPLKPASLTGHLLVGLFELDAGDSPDYAAVNETVAAVGRAHPGAKGFVNAVLRNFLRRRDELARAAEADTEARWNFPEWWRQRLQDEYPEAWEDLVHTLNGHPPMTLRVNRRRLAREAYGDLLAAAGIAARPVGDAGFHLPSPLPVAELPGFADGLVSVQDLGAQWAAPLLQAADGLRVLDACAAPGGKAAHLLERHELDLLALDSSPERLEPMRRNLARLGLSARLRAADAGRPDDWWDGRPFDRILLDAPCTGSGVVRRHPDGKWLKREGDAPQLAREQSRLLEALWPLLRPGGKILYATCSLFRAENGDQVARFLARHPEAVNEGLDLASARAGQFLPDPEMDGFFYARFIKT